MSQIGHYGTQKVVYTKHTNFYTDTLYLGGWLLQSLFFVGFLEVSLKAVYPTFKNVSERMELSEKGGKGGN